MLSSLEGTWKVVILILGRRIACELLKGIATYLKAEVTAIVSAQIPNLLSSFACKPSCQLKDKDCAIYLVYAVSTNVIIVENFVMSVRVPELQSRCE
ncbi:F-box domain-containing protein [Psidium guajava]|nr:F-box domain-containing protein [Psidium guajava]